MKANQKTGRKSKKGSKNVPETIEERVHRHISDINSKITDEDIQSVRTELDIRKDPEPDLSKEENNNDENQNDPDEQKQKTEQSDETKHTTPWDMMSEGYD